MRANPPRTCSNLPRFALQFHGGNVRVDGEIELRKTCKIRAGQIVRYANTQITVVATATITHAGTPVELASWQGMACKPLSMRVSSHLKFLCHFTFVKQLHKGIADGVILRLCSVQNQSLTQSIGGIKRQKRSE